MPETYSCSIVPPGKTAKDALRKRLSLSRYTLDEAKYIELHWKKYIKEGGKNADYVLPKFERLQMRKPTYEHKEEVIEKGIVVETMVRSPHMFNRINFDDLKVDFSLGGVSFALIGSTKSGKSFAMRWIWDKFFKKHISILMTLSRQSDIYAPLKKKALVASGFFPSLISEPMKINRNTNNHYKFCLIFDDLAMDGKSSEQMTKLLTIGRNHGTSAIICGQKLEMLNATGRGNVNFILCFNQITDSAIENTVKTYLRSYFPPGMRIAEMCKIYKEATLDHNFFIIDALNGKCFLSKIDD